MILTYYMKKSKRFYRDAFYNRCKPRDHGDVEDVFVLRFVDTDVVARR
jgi:hypothetical protein